MATAKAQPPLVRVVPDFGSSSESGAYGQPGALLGIAADSAAQSVPEYGNDSGTSPWTPQNLVDAGGVRGWYRGDDFTADLSGAGNGLTPSASPPTLAADFNGSGLPAAAFNGSDQYYERLIFDWGESPLSTGASCLMIARLVTSTSGARTFVYDGTQLSMRETTASRLQWRAVSTTGLTQPASAMVDARVVSGQWDGPAGTFALNTGGLPTQTGAQSPGATLVNGNTIWIGGTPLTTDSAIEIAEMLILNRPLTAAELAQWEDYAKRIYAVPAITSPEVVTAPTVSGLPLAGETLLVTAGAIQAAAGLPVTTSFRWIRGGVAVGGGIVGGTVVGTGSSYTVQAADEGQFLSVQQISQNQIGTGTAYSSQTLVVLNNTLAISGFSASDFLEQSGLDSPSLAGADITMLCVFRRNGAWNQEILFSRNDSYGAGSSGFFVWMDNDDRYVFTSGCGNANGVIGGEDTADDDGKIHVLGAIWGPTDATAQTISEGLGGDWSASTPYADPGVGVPTRIGFWAAGANPATHAEYLGHVIVQGLVDGADLISWWRECRLAGRVVAPTGYTVLEHLDVTTDVGAIGACPATVYPSIGNPFSLAGSLLVSSVASSVWEMPGGRTEAPSSVTSAPATFVPNVGSARIMQCGDSLTAGIPATPNGPRLAVYDGLTLHAAPFDLVGSQSPPGGTVPDNDCSAVAGNTTNQIRTRVSADVVTYSPHVLTIMCGANNFGGAASLSSVLYDLELMLDEIYAAQPGATVILGPGGPWSTSVPYGGSLKNGQRCQDGWNDVVLRIATRQAELGRSVLVAPTASSYSESQVADNVHPDGPGFAGLGTDGWLPALLRALSGRSFP